MQVRDKSKGDSVCQHLKLSSPWKAMTANLYDRKLDSPAFMALGGWLQDSKNKIENHN